MKKKRWLKIAAPMTSLRGGHHFSQVIACLSDLSDQSQTDDEVDPVEEVERAEPPTLLTLHVDLRLSLPLLPQDRTVLAANQRRRSLKKFLLNSVHRKFRTTESSEEAKWN